MTNVNVHLVGHPQRELNRSLLVGLRAYHAPVLVADRKAIFSTPLRNLQWERDRVSSRCEHKGRQGPGLQQGPIHH